MSENLEKNIKSLCIYMLKSARENLDEYIKPKYEVDDVAIKPEFLLDGKIYYPSTRSAPPRCPRSPCPANGSWSIQYTNRRRYPT